MSNPTCLGMQILVREIRVHRVLFVSPRTSLIGPRPLPIFCKILPGSKLHIFKLLCSPFFCIDKIYITGTGWANVIYLPDLNQSPTNRHHSYQKVYQNFPLFTPPSSPLRQVYLSQVLPPHQKYINTRKLEYINQSPNLLNSALIGQSILDSQWSKIRDISH